MNSEISTSPSGSDAGGFQAWHLYLLLGMAGATVAVWRATDTHPVALLLLSAGVLAAGLVAIAVHYAALGFLGEATLERESIDRRTRVALEQEKALMLRSIKELEFDRAMGKVSDADFTELDARLRSRALSLMAQLDAAQALDEHAPAPSVAAGTESNECPGCQTTNDPDARFCKNCGQKLS